MRRGGVWYYRRRVPKHLQGSLGRAFVQLSLETGDKRVAIRAREVLDVKWSAEFERLDAVGQPQPDPDPAAGAAPSTRPVLTEARAVRIVRAFVQANDERRRQGEATAVFRDVTEKREWEKEIEIDLATLQGRVEMYDEDEALHSYMGKMFPQSAFSIDEHTFPSAEVVGLVKRAAIELERRALARTRDDYSHPHFDALFDPARPSGVTVRDLAEDFLRLKLEEGKAAKVAQKHLDRLTANVVLAREILADDTPVRDINWETCRRFCSVLAQVPRNRTKIYPGLLLADAIERAQGVGSLGAVTQGQYLGTLKEMLALAVKKDLLRVNYADELRPLTVDALPPEERRVPFAVAQLKLLFNCEFYRRCANAGPLPYRHADKSWRYWFPLVSLFTSMRPKEIFQMHVDDLRRTDRGTWFLDVVATTDEDDVSDRSRKKTVKTPTSRRQIPLHPELQRLGFVSFVEDQRAASEDPLLFPDITRNKYDDPAAYPLRRFREAYLKVMNLKPRQTAYSFRHTFRDAARRINASSDFLKGVAAWSDGKTTADIYGSKHQPDHHAGEIARIGYEDLDLSHLYVKEPGHST